MLDADLVNRTLAAAMRTGADFAEIFAEDRRSSSAILDDGRVEEVVSGRDRGAGIRVVVGETTGFAHTADLSEAGLSRRGRRSRGRGPAVGRREACRRGVGAGCATAAHRAGASRGRPQVGEGGAAHRGRRRSPVHRRGHHPGVGPLRRRPAPNPGGRQRRPVHQRRPGEDPVLGVLRSLGRHRHADGPGVGRPHRRVRVVRPLRRGGDGPPGCPEGAHQAHGPACAQRRDAGGGRPRRRRGAVPRGVRARPGGRPGGQVGLGVRGAHR